MHTLKDADLSGEIVLVDCSDARFDATPLTQAGINRDAMLQLMHAQDATGRWLIGVEVFVAVYGAAGFDALSRLWGNRWLRPLWDRLYPWVARNRYGLSRLGLHRLFGLLPPRASLDGCAEECKSDGTNRSARVRGR